MRGFTDGSSHDTGNIVITRPVIIQMLRNEEHYLKISSPYWKHKVESHVMSLNLYQQFYIGIARAPLQLAWDFSTASEACLTGRLLYVRDDALKRIGNDGKYRIVRVENNYSENIYRLIIILYM